MRIRNPGKRSITKIFGCPSGFDWYWTNGQNVSQLRIHSWNNQGMYVVDNIRITGS